MKRLVEVLLIDGLVRTPLALTFGDLLAIDPAAQVPDVSRLIASRQGGGVRLRAILDAAGPAPGAEVATLHASKDGFRVSTPAGPLGDAAIVVYRLGDGPLGEDRGGPFRLIVPGPGDGSVQAFDDCLNVKFLDRIELKNR